jgi:hypothetical protein
MYSQKNLDELLNRANNTLGAISNRVWLDGWPTKRAIVDLTKFLKKLDGIINTGNDND